MLIGIPLTETSTLRISLVVPGISVTIAASAPEIAFNKVDFPEFGYPAITTWRPSLIITPCFALVKTVSKSVKHSVTILRIVSFELNSKSSSEKSIAASTLIRVLVSCSCIFLIRSENAPRNVLEADFACCSVPASIRSATASACAKSILPFKNDRSVNSPGLAITAPRLRSLLRISFNKGKLP